MASYRELLGRVKEEIEEISSTARARPAVVRRFAALRRCPRAGRVGRGSHPPGDPRATRLARGPHRGPRARQVSSSRHLLLGGITLGVCGEGARRDGLRGRRQSRRRLHGLEAERLRRDDPSRPLVRAALPLQPSPPHPGGRRGRPAANPRRARASGRRRRARLAGSAVPRRCRCRDARNRGRRRRRRVEPPASDHPCDGSSGGAEGALGEADDRGAQSGRARPAVRGAADLRERSIGSWAKGGT